MLTRNVAYYEARVVFGMASLIPALLLPAYGILGWLIWMSQNRRPGAGELLSACILILPLGAGLAAAHLMTIEREEEFDALRRSYPEQAWRIPLLRSLGAVIFMLLSAGLAGLVFVIAFGTSNLGEILLPALPPAFYIIGLTLLVNNLVGNYWISAAGVVGYWYMEFQTSGKYTGALYLFNGISPLANLDPAVNRLLLVAVGLVWFTLNAAYSIWRRRQAIG
jgi:hypothetical protein